MMYELEDNARRLGLSAFNVAEWFNSFTYRNAAYIRVMTNPVELVTYWSMSEAETAVAAKIRKSLDDIDKEFDEIISGAIELTSKEFDEKLNELNGRFKTHFDVNCVDTLDGRRYRFLTSNRINSHGLAVPICGLVFCPYVINPSMIRYALLKTPIFNDLVYKMIC